MQLNRNPQAVHHRDLLEITPALRYDGSASFPIWQSETRARLASLLGLDRITPAEDSMLTVERKEHDGFTEYVISFQSEEGYFVPCNLWVPDGVTEKAPLVICLQGHSYGMHISLGRP